MSDADAVLDATRAVILDSTWLVCFRDNVPRKSMYRGEDVVRGRRVILAHPDDRDEVLAGLRILNVPHEIEGESDGAA